MAVQICTVGGFSEVGKNMTAIKIGQEVIICDIGFYMPEIIKYEEEEGDKLAFDRESLIKRQAAPNDRVIEDWKHYAKAIVFTHAHLDHIGALPYYAPQYKCPVYGSPYTIELINQILKEEAIKLPNALKQLNPNASTKISNSITLEFINTTHSTPQTVMAALHTKEGTIIYANDFKFDSTPVLGKPPNFERIKELGDSGKVIALVVDALYADLPVKTPSEAVAREMLREVLLSTSNKENLIIVTTFASHIARLKSIVEFGKKLHRKIVFLGRSLHKYVKAAEHLNLINFSKEGIEVLSYRDKISKKLKHIEHERGKYLIVCTGNQGEPKAVLMKMILGAYKFNFEKDDQVIFSSKVIPCQINIENRAKMEEKLKEKKVRIFRDIHTSGHCGREDLRDLIKMLKPKHIIPAHGEHSKLLALADLAASMGYPKENIHVCKDNDIIDINY